MSSNPFGPRPADRPPQREDWGAGATMSLIAHAALVAALVWGVHWHTATQEGVEAELWSSVPQFAAPAPTSPPPQPQPQPETKPVPPPPQPTPAPPPPPPVAAPKPPDIVTAQDVEKMRRKEQQQQLDQQKADQAKADAAKAAQDKADKAKLAQQQKLDAAKLAKEHDDYMKRVLGQLDAPAKATGTAARTSGPSANWAGRVAALIRSHLVWADPVDGIKSPEISITLGVDGTILSARISTPSGNPRFDDAVLRAVQATQTLPRDTDGRMPTGGIIVFNPAG